MNSINALIYKEFKYLKYQKKNFYLLILSMIVFPSLLFIPRSSMSINIFSNELIIILFSCFLSFSGGAQFADSSITYERNDKTLELLLSTGFSSLEFTVGKLFIPFIISLILSTYSFIIFQSFNIIFFKINSINFINLAIINYSAGLFGITISFFSKINQKKNTLIIYISILITIGLMSLNFILFNPLLNLLNSIIFFIINFFIIFSIFYLITLKIKKRNIFY